MTSADELRRVLRAAADYRSADENVSGEERQAIRHLITEEGV